MNKYIKHTLIIFPIILSIFLAINIYKYISNINKYNNLTEVSNNYDKKITESTSKKIELQKDLETLQEENKNKINEYEGWIKWNKEIQEKIN